MSEADDIYKQALLRGRFRVVEPAPLPMGVAPQPGELSIEISPTTTGAGEAIQPVAEQAGPRTMGEALFGTQPAPGSLVPEMGKPTGQDGQPAAPPRSLYDLLAERGLVGPAADQTQPGGEAPPITQLLGGIADEVLLASQFVTREDNRNAGERFPAPDVAQQIFQESGLIADENRMFVARDDSGQLKVYMRAKPLDERTGLEVAGDIADAAGSVLAAGMLDPMGGAGAGMSAAARAIEGTQGAAATTNAGLGPMMAGAAKTAARVDQPIIEGADLTGKAGKYVTVREATDAETQAFQQAQGTAATTGKPSPTISFNLDNIVAPDDVKRTIDAAGKMWGKPQKVTFADIEAAAQTAGIDEKFLARVMNRGEGGELLNGPEMLNALRALTASGAELERLSRLVLTPAATDLDKLKFRQQLAFHAGLSKSVKGIQSDIARTLAIFRIPRAAADVQAGEAIREVLDAYGGDQSVRDLAQAYLTLDTQKARNAVTEAGWAAKAKDAFLFQYINGLLSSPVTPIANIGSSVAQFGKTILERQLASLVSSGRRVIPGQDPERVAVGEATAMIQGLLRGFGEGMTLATRSFKENLPIQDVASRVEIMRGDRINPISAENFGLTGGLGKAVNYYGLAVGMPGRLNMALDEFVKAIGYRMELHAQAARGADAMWRDLTAKGVPQAQIDKQIADWAQAFIDNPPDSVKAAAQQFGREMSFSDRLQSETLRNVEKTINSSVIAKTVIPFFRTPVNIMSETIRSTPFAPISQKFRAEWQAGGATRDVAVAKMTLGSLALASAASWASDGRITGSGPRDPALKQALMRQGWQPYSFVFDKDGLSARDMKALEKVGTVSVGPDKVFVSYRRFEPASAILAIGADVGQYLARTDDPAQADELAMGAAIAVKDYMAEQPMLTGIAKLNDIASSMSSDPEKAANEMVKGVASMASQTGLTGLTPYSSLLASYERYSDPTATGTLPLTFDPDGSATMQGLAQGMQAWANRVPGLSDMNLPQLDLFGRERQQGQGEFWEMMVPIRISPGKLSPADQVLIDAGMPLKMPPMRIEGIQLSGEQYNRWITLMNEVQDPATGRTLAEQIAWLGEQPEFQELPRGEGSTELGVAGQQGVLSKVYSTYRRAGQELLMQEFPELRDAVKAVEMQRAIQGR